MVVYNIVLGENKLDAQLFEPYPVEYIEFNHSAFYNHVDYDFMKNRYGFPLSVDEIKIFQTHICIWRTFLSTKSSYCLVIENVKELKQSFATISKGLTRLPSDWEIFFPYDGEKNNHRPDNYQYILGYRWGTDAYFLHRKGAQKLLESKVIKQPVDEEILEMVQNDELNFYYEDTDYFLYNTDCRYYEQRRRTIKDAIFSITAWSKENKERAKALLRKLTEISKENGLKLVLCDGSLLGQIRHGGMMAWDDDIDLAIDEVDLEKLLNALNKDKKLRYKQWFWKNSLYYKVWGVNGEPIQGYEYLFPFIDIWLYRNEENEIKFNYGITYPENKFYPLQETVFEEVPLSIPKDPITCLDLTYKNWQKYIVVYPWSHREEKRSFPMLQVEIEVDDNGKMIQD